MFTLGSDSQYPDWEAMWKQELSRDDTKRPKGLFAFVTTALPQMPFAHVAHIFKIVHEGSVNSGPLIRHNAMHKLPSSAAFLSQMIHPSLSCRMDRPH